MGLRPAIAALAVGALLVSPATADEIGNPQRGLEYAQANCAECHSVLPEDYVSPVLEAPSFQAVAETKGVTRLALTAFLQTPHADMPNLVVTGEDADNVIAYILSLKGATAAGLR